MRTVWIWLLGNLICVSAHADLIQFANFSDVSEFTLNSDAAVQNPNSDDVLRVSGTENSVGTAFITNLVDFGLDGSFLTHFSFQISDDGFDSEADIGGADGMAFVIQSTSNEAVGRSGGGIGYQFIENSLAVEFDTWFNLESDRNDIDGNHVGIALNGDASNEIAQASGADPLDTGNIFHTGAT